MRTKAQFICHLISAMALIGGVHASDDPGVIIDGMVGLKAGDSYFFVSEATDEKEHGLIRDIMLEFASDFEDLFGKPPAPCTLVFYDDIDVQWIENAAKFQQPSTPWYFAWGSVTFWDKMFRAQQEESLKQNPEQDLGVDLDEWEFTWEMNKPLIKHELTHFAFYNTFWSGEDVPLDWSTNAPYGDGPIPDALDDGMADYLTTEAHRQGRRDVFKTQLENGFEFLPLAELFEVTNIWHKAKSGPASEIPGVAPEEIEHNRFLMYNQGFVVFEFILELGGLDIFRHMIAGYQEYKDMDQILAEYGGKGGVPTSVAELDRLWWDDIEKGQ